MKYLQIFLISLLLTFGISTYYQVSGETDKANAPSLEDLDLGNHHHSIQTTSSLAQSYFDRGLILAYGFNHAEAARSFKEAIRLDPDCAMCYWGLAYVLGPNINAPMQEDKVSEAYSAVQKALELAENSSEKERAYIKALSVRYTDTPMEDRSFLDRAYAEAMGEVVRRYQNDLDAATLYAEALMDTMPWDYWTEGEPKPETEVVLSTLESVLKRNPNHPGANHLYIHAVEAVYPERGIAAADRLRNLVPDSGHLVHMPSHIYIRVGRYHDAAIANERAILADQNYMAKSNPEGIYPLAYMPHNHHFLWFSGMMEGRSELSMKAAADLAAMVDEETMRESGMGVLQHFYSIPLYTQIRFGRWDEILSQPNPAPDLQYPTGVWHFARGMALAAKGQLKEANRELKQLEKIKRDPALAEVTIWDINSTQSVLEIASQVLAGELAARVGNYDEAIAHLQEAVSLEDKLNYTEPPDWSFPTRQYLGAVMLEADRPAAAEKIYREDLEIYPDNGWSLFGLVQSLRTQNRETEAQLVEKQFRSAWRYADVKLNASRI